MQEFTEKQIFEMHSEKIIECADVMMQTFSLSGKQLLGYQAFELASRLISSEYLRHAVHEITSVIDEVNDTLINIQVEDFSDLSKEDFDFYLDAISKIREFQLKQKERKKEIGIFLKRFRQSKFDLLTLKNDL